MALGARLGSSRADQPPSTAHGGDPRCRCAEPRGHGGRRDLVGDARDQTRDARCHAVGGSIPTGRCPAASSRHSDRCGRGSRDRVADFRVVDGDVPTHRHPRHRTPPAHLSRSRAVHAPSESTSPPTEGATPPNSGSYRSSSSTPAYSSQPAAGEAAASARAPTQSAPQPAGPTGLGGVVGSNCNPKCR